MKIIISPAKTMKPCHQATGTTPLFIKEANQIRQELINDPNLYKKYKYNEEKTNVIKELMTTPLAYPALEYYDGTAFKQITSRKNLDLLYILDAMYGVLKPTDLISYYRLDFLMRPDLYSFYHDQINELFQNDLIINLASKEYSKLIDQPMITIDFIVIQDGKIKRPSMQLKKCRGLFANALLEDPNQDLESIIVDGFIYDEALSTKDNYIYKLVKG